MVEGEVNPEAEYEQIREVVLGVFDELVAEAEDLVDDQGGGVIRETEETAQLWEELKERYGLVVADLDRRSDALDGSVRARLEVDLHDLKAKVEAAFGTGLG